MRLRAIGIHEVVVVVVAGGRRDLLFIHDDDSGRRVQLRDFWSMGRFVCFGVLTLMFVYICL